MTSLQIGVLLIVALGVIIVLALDHPSLPQ